MKIERMFLAVCACLGFAHAARAALASEIARSAEKDPLPVPAASVALTDYDVLFKRHIFSREQPRPKPDPRFERPAFEEPRVRPRDTGPKPGGNLILIGIVIKDDTPAAFLEDRRAEKTITVKPGEKVAGGKIGAITLESIEFITDDKTTTITIGRNLQGGLASSKPAESSSSSSSSSSNSSAAAGTEDGSGETKGGADAAGDGNLSILEKLRRKRLKEQNK